MYDILIISSSSSSSISSIINSSSSSRVSGCFSGSSSRKYSGWSSSSSSSISGSSNRITDDLLFPVCLCSNTREVYSTEGGFMRKCMFLRCTLSVLYRIRINFLFRRL
jgi:hypothetical protein